MMLVHKMNASPQDDKSSQDDKSLQDDKSSQDAYQSWHHHSPFSKESESQCSEL